MTSSVDSASQITISAANHAISTGTDLAYQSVNGNTAASSTSGYAFSPAASFQIAIDFNVSFTSAVGGLALGFGIGEDIDGTNSAGAVLFTQNGSPGAPPFIPPFGVAGRVNDVNQTPVAIVAAGQLNGSFFVTYDATTGNVTGGVGNAGDSSPFATATLNGIQNGWTDAMLFPAFFLRSDGTAGQAWTSGTASAVLSNFRVLSGTPIAVPEPGTIGLLTWFALAVPCARRGMRRARARGQGRNSYASQ
jgi:hypothetical protein